MRRYLVVAVLASMLIVVGVGVAAAAPEFQQSGAIHYVDFGETLHHIAAQYGVSVEAIMRQNGLTNPNMIYVGQPLVIPLVGPYAGRSVAGCGQYHTVRAGDTLSDIAWQYGVAPDDLIAHNELYNPNMVFVGQKICIPGSGYAPQPQQAGYYHSVATGETLSSIAYRYNVDTINIIRANNLQNAALLLPGQRLLIPGYKPSAAPVELEYPPARPPAAPPPAPPSAPRYEDARDETYAPPPYEPPPAAEEEVHILPSPPDYQPDAAHPPLPEADHPLQVVVNGGQTWHGDVYPDWPDPDGITTLIVNVDWSMTPTVKLRSGDMEVEGFLDLVPEFGIDKPRYVFRYIPPGDYDVWLEDPDTPSEKAYVEVQAGKRIEVGFTRGLAFQGPSFASPDGWYLASWDNESMPKQNIGSWSNIMVKAPASGLKINITSDGNSYQAACVTGAKGPGMCDFAGLSAGFYYLWIDNTDLTIKTYMDGDSYATFEFGRQSVPAQDRGKVGPVDY